jgi:hypothetical protein
MLFLVMALELERDVELLGRDQPGFDHEVPEPADGHGPLDVDRGVELLQRSTFFQRRGRSGPRGMQRLHSQLRLGIHSHLQRRFYG